MNLRMKRLIKPLAISTWKHGFNACKKSYEILNNDGSALDAVEFGINVTEGDPEVRTVGYGGYTDQEGNVTLDACIMDHLGNAGSVVYLENIKHPISVARKVMEKSNHVMLAGNGAYEFALKNGFKKENILFNQSRKDWLEWKKNNTKIKNLINEDNHDTVTLLALDKNGNLAAGSSTSGLRYKLNGRVGDCPIIGSGIFVDNSIGAAGATGQGEEIMQTVGSFLIVELMKQGYHPNEACKEAINRILKKHNEIDFQAAYIALRADGEVGAAAINNGFSYILSSNLNTTINKVLKTI